MPARSAVAIALVFVVLAGCRSMTRSVSPTPSAESGEAVLPGCGQPMNEAAANGWPISMTARFPALPSRPPDDLLRGAVSLTNELDVRLVGTGAAQPDLALVRDGRVVALPVGLRLVALTLDLPPGGTQDLEASASLRSCEAGPYPAGTPLSSGPYQVFAAYQVDITPPSEDPGTLVVRGGPWPIFLP